LQHFTLDLTQTRHMGGVVELSVGNRTCDL